ncbi:hypothetical protein [Streptomyces sp. NPDC001828]|uniref:hypothetical protein n=1 Tax=Streptomyces sp. NPDC001828 TaxID=3364615 RepID=UPI003681CDCD
MVHLLSLPSGAREDVRTLADRNPVVGRKGVQDAVEELIRERYYFRHTYRDDQGRVRTETFVFDTPQAEFSPVPVPPGTGSPVSGRTGTLPSGVKDLGSRTQEISLPSPSSDSVAVAPDEDGRAGEAERILGRLEAVDGRLRLSRRQTQSVTPLVTQWLQRGATVAEITDAVTQGLPERIYSAAKLVTDRLTRKLPAPRRSWESYADCAECRNPLPVGQASGICARCAGLSAPVAVESGGLDSGVVATAARIREAMRARRVVAGGAR